IEILFDSATRAKLSGARANDLVIDCKLRNASSLHPLREEIAQVFHGYLRCQLFEIIDRSVLTTILLEKGMQQTIEFLFSHAFAKHAKDHRSEEHTSELHSL